MCTVISQSCTDSSHGFVSTDNYIKWEAFQIILHVFLIVTYRSQEVIHNEIYLCSICMYLVTCGYCTVVKLVSVISSICIPYFT